MDSEKETNGNLWVKSIALTSIGFIAFKLCFKSCIKDINSNPHDNVRGHWSHEVLDTEPNQTDTDSNTLIHSTDHFNGVRINSETLPTDETEFESKLNHSLMKWRKEEKRGIFLKLPIQFAATHLQITLSNGFTVHHARPEYIMLTQWLPSNETNMIPDYCHTYLATGCVIINRYKQAVVIKEIWNHGRLDHWKLPGGAVDRLENIFDAAVRETKEETGLDTEFKGILQMRHFHPGRFMNTGDIYFICLLKYDGDTDGGHEFNVDSNEIDEIK
eukprot:110750_1